jgi:hypothetical protein
VLFIIMLGFSSFLAIENYVNANFQDFDVSFDLNNAYDIKYCDSYRSELNFRKYILTPGFYVKCKLLEWLNIMNNILNNVLFFFSHFPELLVTLIFYFYKSRDFIDFCYASYDCTSLIEMAQVFHLISIGFQFFIFLKFDQNVHGSILCLVKLYFKLK